MPPRGRGAAKPNSTVRVRAADRQAKALELRLAGWRLDEIAKKIGYNSTQSVGAAIQAAIERSIKGPALEMRDIILARNEAYLKAIYPRAMNGDLDAIDRCIKIGQQNAAISGLISKSVKVGQDPNAAPVGVNVAGQVDVSLNLYQALKRMTPEDRELLRVLRERMVGSPSADSSAPTNGVGPDQPAS